MNINLDVSTKSLILSLLEKLLKIRKVTILHATHNPADVTRFTTKMVQVKDHKVKCSHLKLNKMKIAIAIERHLQSIMNY